jgi:hypothetical protein
MSRFKLVLVVLLSAGAFAVPLSGSASATTCSSLSGISLSTTSVTATASLRARVRLRCAVSRAVTVRLTGTSGLRVPTSVVVRRGARSAVATIGTLPTSTTRKDTVRAFLGGARRTASLTVRTGCASRISGFTTPAGLYAGEKATGTLTLGCAPASDVSVALRSDDPTLTAPSRVTVRAGHTGAAIPVSASLAFADQRTSHLTATYAGLGRRSSVLITPGLAFLEVDPTTSGPGMVDVEVALTGEAPAAGIKVSLKSSDPLLTVPATFSLSQGGTAGDTWVDVGGPVTQDTPVTISATLGSRTVSTTTVVLRPWNATTDAAHVSLPEGNLYGLRHDIAFSIGIDRPAPEGGVPVSWHVRGDDPAFTSLDTSGAINAGRRSVSFMGDAADVTQTTTVYIDATVGGTEVSLVFTIEPRLVALTLPDTISGGSDFTGTITLAGPSTSDRRFDLDPLAGGVHVDSSVVVPAGQISASFHGSVDAGATESWTARLWAHDPTDDFDPDQIESNTMTVTP